MKDLRPNPLLKANPISKLFFCWLNGLLGKGYGQTLEVQDMLAVCPEDQSGILGDRLEKEWAKEIDGATEVKHEPSLIRVLFRIFGFKYILFSCLLFIEEATKVLQPVLLGSLVNYFTPEPSITRTEAFLYAMGVSLCAILQALLYHPYAFFVYRLGMKIRVACCSLMYRKCLRLSNAGFSRTTTGQIVNLMSNDVNKIDLTVTLLPFLFVAPIQAVFVIGILWSRIGKPMLAGIAVLVVLITVQIFMSKLFSKFRERTAKYTDKRVTVMNEIIAGMRILKMYCWEHSFRDLIKGIRRSELQVVRMTSYLSAILETINRNGRCFCIYATIVFYVLSNQQFRAGDLYVVIGLLNALSMNALLFVALAIKHAAQTAVSFKRITSFLKLEELNNFQKDSLEDDKARSETKFIELKQATAKWNETSAQPALHNVTTSVRDHELLAVIGQVGSGKSSLLSAILKELPLTEGTLKVSGRLAYVCQQAWVFSASIKENILFGNDFEPNKYNRIIGACALDMDLSVLPKGDSTLIGDRGVKLSGGQRARVAIARALYTEADIYLLDDPFSAVDANVARHIFENVIQDLLKYKAKILVTHSLQFLHAASNIIILKEGKLVATNTFDGFCNAGFDLSTFLKREDKTVGKKPGVSNHEENDILTSITNPGSDKSAVYSLDNISIDDSTEASVMHRLIKTEDNDMQKEEGYQTGTVSLSVYIKYLQAGTGVLKGLLLVILCLAAQALVIYSDWWLSQWSNKNEAEFSIDKLAVGNDSGAVTLEVVDSHTNLAIYSGLIAGLILFGIARAFLFFKVAIDAAATLHKAIFRSIIRSRISFFDTNPIGRVLNRFSKDMGLIDEVLPLTLFDLLQCVLLIVGMVCVVAVVNPWIFISIVPLFVILLCVRHYYVRTSRQIQRLEGVTRSPVFSHLSATLQGLHTIRAFRMQSSFQRKFDGYQDVHTAAWFLFLAAGRWMAVRVDWICALFVTTVAFASVLAVESLNAGLVGMSLTYAFVVMGIFQWTIRQSTLTENQMVSVERILDYCKLPAEAPLDTDGKRKPNKDWPAKGEIVTENACLKYSDDSPYILKNLTFSVHPKEKVGIIGRTGAGKSSLIAMFVRLVEPEGSVTIDGVNIQDIGLHDLRHCISVIPQDPVLFTGPLRRNLDSFGEYEDKSLWHVLEAVEMKPAIDSLPHGLDTEVSEDGINFSVGQRQLICLARAMLRESKILIIDEATANVDTRTDFLIQKAIREMFSKCTVLTIAHRLHTVMDSHRLIVLDQGTIKEFDAPFVLMQNTDGFLYSLVQHMGNEYIAVLTELARAAFVQKYQSQSAAGTNMRPNNYLQLNEKPWNVESDACITHL